MLSTIKRILLYRHAGRHRHVYTRECNDVSFWWLTSSAFVCKAFAREEAPSLSCFLLELAPSPFPLLSANLSG